MSKYFSLIEYWDFISYHQDGLWLEFVNYQPLLASIFIYATPDMKCTSPHISIDCVAETWDKTANALSA